MEQAKLLLGDPDAKAKTQGLEQLADLIKTLPCNADEPAVVAIIKSLREMLKGNNAKTVQLTLTVFCDLAHKHGPAARKYFDRICESVIERLGDSKVAIRQEATTLYTQFIIGMGDPGYVWNRLQQQSVQSKSSHVRHSALICYLRCVDHFGLNFIPVASIIPYVLNLLDDPLPAVREEVMRCLTTFYRHIGPDCALYLTQNAGLRPAHLKNIQRLIEETEPVPENERAQIDWSRISMKAGTLTSPKSTFDDTGALEPASDIVPMLITTESDLETEIDQIVDILKDCKSHWQDRVGAVRKLGGLALGPARRLPSFFQQLRRCLNGMAVQANDLRSAVAKEACVIVTFLSRTLGAEFSSFSDAILPDFVRLTNSSIQVVADAADKCVRSIIQHNRLNSAIRKIIEFARGKSPALRATATEYLALVLLSCSTDSLERYLDAILEQIRYSLTDANENARLSARSCYWALRAQWPQRAQQVFDALDLGVQRTLLQSAPENSSQRLTPMPKSRRRSKPLPAPVSLTVKEKENDIDKEQKDPNQTAATAKVPASPDTADVFSARNAFHRCLPPVGGAVRVIRPDHDDSNNRNQGTEFRAQIVERRAQPPAERVLSARSNGERTSISEIDEAMELCSSKDWNERLAAFQFISENTMMLQSCDGRRVVDLFRSHINDRNSKVSVVCLTALNTFLSNLSATYSGLCVNLLQSLIFAQLDTKEQIRQIASSAINNLYQCCDVHDLMKELLQLVQSKMVKLQGVALQGVLRIGEARNQELVQFFKNTQNMDWAISKLQPLLSLDRPVLHTSLCNILRMMSDCAPGVFERQVMQLQHSDQALIYKMVPPATTIATVHVEPTESKQKIPIVGSDGDGPAVNSHSYSETEASSEMSSDTDSYSTATAVCCAEACESPAGSNLLDAPPKFDSLNLLDGSNSLYCSNALDGSKTLTMLTEDLNRPYLTQKKILQILQDIIAHVEGVAAPMSAMSVKTLLESILRVVKKSNSRQEIHIDVARVLHALLIRNSTRPLISACYSLVFECLFALQVDRVSVFEAAADAFDFVDCVGVIESKLSDPEAPRADLVTTIELISHSLLLSQKEQKDPKKIKWALDRFIPLMPSMLKHKDIDVRKSCVFCIIDLYSELDAEFLSGLWPLLKPVQLKLLRVFIDKRGLPVPPMDV